MQGGATLQMPPWHLELSSPGPASEPLFKSLLITFVVRSVNAANLQAMKDSRHHRTTNKLLWLVKPGRQAEW